MVIRPRVHRRKPVGMPPQDIASRIERQVPGKLWEVAIVVLFTLAVTVPFIAKPFDMDDYGFLKFAEARQDSPLQLQLKDFTFFGQQNQDFLDTHPPLISSYLALLIKVSGGESETLLHAAFLVFPLMAAVSMYFLARRFTRHRLLATLLMMATPGAIVMSHNLMSDMPGLSLWLAAVALYLYGLDRRSLTLMGLCGVVLTLGVFTSYQVLSVIPLLLVYTAIRRELSVLSVLPFALPLSAFFSFAGWHLAVYGMLPRLSYGTGAPLAWYSVIQKGASAMLAIGGATAFFGIIMQAVWARRGDFLIWAAFLAPLWVAGAFEYLVGQYTLAAALLIVLFMPLGIVLTYRLVADGWRRFDAEWKRSGLTEKLADNVFLILWLVGVLFYVVVLLPYSSVRYLLPLFPPLILLFVRLVEDRFPGQRAAANILAVGVAATAGLGLLVGLSDYELSVAQRDFAQQDGARLKQQAQASGHQAWFVGEFGFRYYMEQQGLQELPEDAVPPDGDIVLQSPLADPRPFSEDMKDRVDLADTIRYRALLPIRVTSFQAHAGFYGSFWGLLPYSLSTGSVEEYLIYNVVPPKQDSAGQENTVTD